MAIVLDKHNEIKTDYFDFIESLEDLENGLRCCFDIDLIFHEHAQTDIKELKLIPLEDFACERTIIGDNGTKIKLESNFGLIQKDFINIGFQSVQLIDKTDYKLQGILINKKNDYFEIVNELAIYLNLVDAANTDSFILDECDLSEIQLLPFRLFYKDGKFVVCDFEKEMAMKEYDAIVDNLYCSDFAL